MANLFNTTTTSLLAYQRVLNTIGHNISNANTEGYSRQSVELNARTPQPFVNGFIGGGVFISGIERIADQFVVQQLQQATSENSRLATFVSMADQLDNLLADDQGGIAPSLQGFFSSVQDLANDPSSAPARQLLLSEAQNLIDRFDFAQQQLNAQDAAINNRLDNLVLEVNSLAENIASINGDIILANNQGNGLPNDLLDQREQLIKELSNYVSVTAIPESTGATNIFIGNGQALVVGTDVRTLTTVQDPTNFSQRQIAYDTGSGVINIGNQVSGGEIGGLLDFRREMLDPTLNELGRVAMVLADTFNTQHRNGMDLNGNLGGDLFNVPSPVSIANLNNAGTATVTTTVTDFTQLTASDYSLSYDGANYTLTRLSDNVSVSGAGPLALDGLNVSISAGAAAGDSFLIQPTNSAAGGLSLAFTDSNLIAAASPVRTEAVLSNISDAVIDAGQVLDVTDPDLLDTVEIVFNNPPTTFDIVNITDATTISVGVAYTSGNNIDFNGVRVVVSGTPEAGDTFRLQENTGGVTDNRNALLLSDLQTQVFVGGTATYQETYTSLIGTVGTQTSQAQGNLSAQSTLLSQAQLTRDSISGVNLDEEAINLTKFEQAYQASAQVVATADSLFQTLLAVVSR